MFLLVRKLYLLYIIIECVPTTSTSKGHYLLYIIIEGFPTTSTSKGLYLLYIIIEGVPTSEEALFTVHYDWRCSYY